MTQISADVEKSERDSQTFAIIGACMAVHNEIGHGVLEAVYQEALEIEFTRREIPFVREKRLVIWFTDVQLQTYYESDFVWPRIQAFNPLPPICEHLRHLLTMDRKTTYASMSVIFRSLLNPVDCHASMDRRLEADVS
jgi:hypothetical protein